MAKQTRPVPRNSGHGLAVRRYLSDRPGTDVYFSDMATDLKLSTQQVQKSVAYRISRGDPIERIIHGHVVRWHPNGGSPAATRPAAAAPPPPAAAAPTAPTAATAGTGPPTSEGALVLMKFLTTLTSGDLLLQDTESHILYRATEL